MGKALAIKAHMELHITLLGQVEIQESHKRSSNKLEQPLEGKKKRSHRNVNSTKVLIIWFTVSAPHFIVVSRKSYEDDGHSYG